MATYLDCKTDYQKEKLQTAAQYIKEGKLVLFPTETVYGIGADGLNAEAVKNIFIAKGRKQDNPLILHVSSIDMVERIAKDINDIEYELMKKFFPGPLTIILKRKDIVPNIVTGTKNDISAGPLNSSKVITPIMKPMNVAQSPANIFAGWKLCNKNPKVDPNIINVNIITKLPYLPWKNPIIPIVK